MCDFNPKRRYGNTPRPEASYTRSFSVLASRPVPATLWIALLVIFGVAPGCARSESPRAATWVTNGPVLAIAATPTTTYIGGLFDYVGPNTGGGALLDWSTGKPSSKFPKVDDAVEACVSDGSGGWYIGGWFTKVGPQVRNGLAHILPDGSVDSAWDPSPSGERPGVRRLARSGSIVYVSGFFDQIGGAIRNNLAALDATSGAATSWNPCVNGDVYALDVSGNTVYIGGTFTMVGAVPRNYIAAVDATTGLIGAWDPCAVNENVSGDGGNCAACYGVRPGVFALAVSGSVVYAGGSFTRIGGQPRNYIAALDAGTGMATAWDPDASGGDLETKINALAVSDGRVYAGGSFSVIGGQTRFNVAALDSVTGLATPWDPRAESQNPPGALFNVTRIYSLVVSDDIVLVGGSFSAVGGQARHNIAALDRATGLATPWNPNAANSVLTLAVSGDAVYVGGQFNSIGGVSRNNLAALDRTSGEATAWDPGVDNGDSSAFVYAMAVSGDAVYAAGFFSNIGGQQRNYVAALDPVTGMATDWNPNPDNFVATLALSEDVVYVGGQFSSIGGQERNGIAALDRVSGLATPWDPNPVSNYPFNILAMEISGETVYVGGYFSTLGGQPRNNIAALDVSTGQVTPWDPNANSGLVATFVDALAVSGDIVYAGGGFTNIGGQPRNYLAALDTTTGLATAWDPSATVPDFAPGGMHSFSGVYSLAVLGDVVYVGGQFSGIGRAARHNLAALDAASGAAVAWNPGADRAVDALLVTGADLLVGGEFWTIGDDRRGGFAEFVSAPTQKLVANRP